MQSLKYSQLVKLAHDLNHSLVGAQLQDLVLNSNYLLFQHYQKGVVLFGVHLNSQNPSVGLLYEDLKKGKSLIKPIVLFLRAHAKNKRLKSIEVFEEEGRILHIKYEGSSEQENSKLEICHIKIILIPRALNILVSCGDKSISMFPPKNFPASKSILEQKEYEEFDLQKYYLDWESIYHTPQRRVEETQEVLLQRKLKALEKKKLGFEHLKQELDKLNNPWMSVGEYLKSKQSLDVPEEWLEFIDLKKSFAENLQNCFTQYKIQERKKEHLLEKLIHLENEIKELENEELLKFSKLKSHQEQNRKTNLSVASQLMHKAGAHGRKISLSDKVEAVVGKSAKDNLALLRKAQAWDLWVHLRDQPSAHAIIRRPRQIQVSHGDILKVAEWVLRQTVKEKNISSGDKYAVIVTECRYVKPIKGDKTGRVIYHNESHLTLFI